MGHWKGKPRYDPKSFTPPLNVSRSAVEEFYQCPRCFWMRFIEGWGHVSTPGYPINTGIDGMAKAEFDIVRKLGLRHRLMPDNKWRASNHPDIDDWRNTWKGVRALFAKGNIELHGAVDDVWVQGNGKLVVVDYKATCSQSGEYTKEWLFETRPYITRQMAIYKAIMKEMGEDMAMSGIILYYNGESRKASFDGVMNFSSHVIKVDPAKGDMSHPDRGGERANNAWVKKIAGEIWDCVNLTAPPPAASNCEYCDRLAVIPAKYP